MARASIGSLASLAVGAAMLAACATDAPPSTSPAPTACASTPTPGTSPIRRLTRFEYDNTLRDLLGDVTRPAQAAFPPEEIALGFDDQAASLVADPLLIEAYMRVSEGVAERALEHLDTWLPCDPKAIGELACADLWIDAFGARAYRRPLDAATKSRLHALYVDGAKQKDFATGIEVVLEAMLQSPRFLYRVELGAPDAVGGDVVELDDWEVASRLSYLFWATMPDAALFAEAAAGHLHDRAAIRAQAERMLADDRARPAIARFHDEWLGLDALDRLKKDPSVYPAFSADLAPLFRRETEETLGAIVLDDKGTFADLLTSTTTRMNAELAAFYGAKGPTTDAFETVTLDATKRAGFLTQASILSVYAKPGESSPVHRGKFVRERLLCEALPPPPNGVAITPPAVDPHATTRERYLQHMADPNCSVCHERMDLVGFGFEHFDGIGRYRATENGLPIDATGEVRGSEDLDGAFDGVLELAQRLSTSEEARACLVTQWLRYGYGRAEEDEDRCSRATIEQAFSTHGSEVRELLIALTQTDAFLYRHRER